VTLIDNNENIYKFIMKHGCSASSIKIAAVEFDVEINDIKETYETQKKYHQKILTNTIRVLDLQGYTKEGIISKLKTTHSEVSNALRNAYSINATIPESLMLWLPSRGKTENVIV